MPSETEAEEAELAEQLVATACPDADSSATLDCTATDAMGQALQVPSVLATVVSEVLDKEPSARLNLRLVNKAWNQAVRDDSQTLHISSAGCLSFPTELLPKYPGLRTIHLLDRPCIGESLTRFTFMSPWLKTVHDDENGFVYIDMKETSQTVSLARGDAPAATQLTCFDGDFFALAGQENPPKKWEWDLELQLLPPWALHDSKGFHIVVQDLSVWQQLRNQAAPSSLLSKFQGADALVHLVLGERLTPEQSRDGQLENVHGISFYLSPPLDARRDLMLVLGDMMAAFEAAPTLRHVWVKFTRQMVFDPAIYGILKHFDQERFAAINGLQLTYMCHHVWTQDGKDGDEAILCMTRFAVAPWFSGYLAAEQAAGVYKHYPSFTCSLYDEDIEAFGLNDN